MTIGKIKELLTNGGLHNQFSSMYRADDYKQQTARYLRAIGDFQSLFNAGDNAEAAIYSAPGRAEICGNHTDHQRGRVLATAVDVDAIGVVMKTEGPVRIISEGFGEILIKDGSGYNADEKGTPVALVKGVMSYFSDHGLESGGFNAYITSNVTEGSGLSSSAAFETLIGAVLYGSYNGWPPPPLLLPQAGRYAENVYFGKPSGLMDQMASAIGGFMYIDFLSDVPVFEQIEPPLEKHGHILCVVDTGRGHADLFDEYASIPRDMKKAATAMGRETLGQCDENVFYGDIARIREASGDRAVLRAFHFFIENDRVKRQLECLRKDLFQEFLDLIAESGRSSLAYLQNVIIPGETSQPIMLALAAASHALGSAGAYRVHGGGFAGTILAIMPEDLYGTFKAAQNTLFGDNACKKLSVRHAGALMVV